MRQPVLALLCVLLILASATACGSARLGEFRAAAGADGPDGGASTSAVYPRVTNYFGYIEPGSEPDDTVGDKKYYYLYVWLPVAVPELGVRMASPVRDLAIPGPGDFAMENWDQGRIDRETYFDTYITFERSTIINPEQVRYAYRSDWTELASNDDSDEMPAQPSGRLHNSLLRITDRSKLLRGLYRIGFTSHKAGDVQGTFVAQVGTAIEVPGIAIGRTPQELSELVQATDGSASASASGTDTGDDSTN